VGSAGFEPATFAVSDRSLPTEDELATLVSVMTRNMLQPSFESSGQFTSSFQEVNSHAIHD
jgi:hypothetical protein